VAMTVICVPFAGGGAVSYVALAKALQASGVPVRVHAVEPPGRTRDDSRPALPTELLATELAAEIAAAVAGPVVLLGHCAGAATALATARALADAQVPVRHLIIVSMVLKSTDPEHHLADDVAQMTDAEVRDWLVEGSGLRGVDGISAREWRDIARAFRHDTLQASLTYARLLRAGGPVARGPATVVLATDDPVTSGHVPKARDWQLLVPDVDVVTLDGGGHYINTTRTEELAACIATAVGLATGSAAVHGRSAGGAS
ncbi:MAG TPA: alpha/beta fold hydrolase, partial [Pseudonocardiaceae bacterium]|nr:alpha/beta fold hydrolase [Pseudonocardiaceae bacterium]